MTGSDPLPSLDDSVGYVLKQATSALHNAMEAALRPHGLTLSQYSCLELLSREPGQSSAQLARGMFVSPQSMNEVLRGLQNRGLVERSPVAESGRARPSKLTPSGEEHVARARTALVPVEERLLSSLTPSDEERLLGALRGIIGSLGAGGADRADRPRAV